MTLAGFEKQYQSSTRRRYGARAVAADLSLVLFVVSVLVLPFFLARRLRDRKRLRAMLAADAAAERAEQASAIAFLLGEAGPRASANGGDEGVTKEPEEGCDDRVSDDGTIA
jgi:hypothetical protein